tara:strand:+ start:1832 stop:2293 length:462 start_codon:yes stop_codon:yes gene_type:complete
MEYYTTQEVKEHLSRAYLIDEDDWETDHNGGVYSDLEPICSSMGQSHENLRYALPSLHYNICIQTVEGKTTVELEADSSEIKDYWRPGIERLMSKRFLCKKISNPEHLFTMLKGNWTPQYFIDFEEHLVKIYPKVVRALDKSVDKEFLSNIGL